MSDRPNVESKNRILDGFTKPLEVFPVNGVPVALVADLIEGGFVSIINGTNPVGIPVPGPSLAPGTMLVVLPVEVATVLRPQFQKAKDEVARALLGQNRPLTGPPN